MASTQEDESAALLGMPQCTICMSSMIRDLVALHCGHVMHEDWCGDGVF